MKWIDKDTWKRKEHYEFFRQLDYPHFGLTVNLDITHFLGWVRENKIPFYYAMIHAVTAAVNEIEELRTRIYQGEPVLWDQVHPAFTALREEDEQFYVVVAKSRPDPAHFAEEAVARLASRNGYFPEELKERGDLFFVTCLPWLTYTGLNQTISLKKDDASPRICWGKYYKAGDQVYLPYSLEVHHSLVDGIHVSRHVAALQAYLDSL